jgi:hypothetical protein
MLPLRTAAVWMILCVVVVTVAARSAAAQDARVLAQSSAGFDMRSRNEDYTDANQEWVRSVNEHNDERRANRVIVVVCVLAGLVAARVVLGIVDAVRRR